MILESTELAPEVRIFWMIPCDGPFFSWFFYVAHRGLRELDCMLWCQFSIFPQKRLSEDHHGTHNPQGHQSFSATFLRLLTELSTSLSVSEMTLVTILTSGFRLVILAYGKVSWITWTFCVCSSKDFSRFLTFQSWKAFSSQIVLLVSCA